jgi:hypothetical protein
MDLKRREAKEKTHMAFEQRPNRGVLFDGNKRDAGDPNMRGRALLEIESGFIELNLDAFFRKGDATQLIELVLYAARGEKRADRKLGTVALFYNQFKKSDEDNSPHMRGHGILNLGDREITVEISAWFAKSDDRVSLSITRKSALGLRERFSAQGNSSGGNVADDSVDKVNDAKDRDTRFFDNEDDDGENF